MFVVMLIKRSIIKTKFVKAGHAVHTAKACSDMYFFFYQQSTSTSVTSDSPRNYLNYFSLHEYTVHVTKLS